MRTELLTFRKYNDEELAKALALLLESKHIGCEIEDDSVFFDVSFAKNEATRQIAVKIRPEDFAAAQQALQDYYEPFINEVEKDYYLLGFSDEELREIIRKPDEWGDFDQALARKILKERGKDIDPAALKEMREQRKEYLAKPSGEGTGLIITGYLLALLGGFFGIFIGWHLYFTKKTLPDGASVPLYADNQRIHGLIIFITSLVMLPVWIYKGSILDPLWVTGPL